ncbi:amidohydrolase family protein [Pseudosporangium ferrugineum]|uniref:Imidazolonepropionase-like amidohydrolase n=1 Tax=Pseudosporangium ferrugineum TaxID=439699 RepID=A0A2T0SBT6_9ACTN|nr:amidohydrolase family protein [Pseudosporangium ferrugineum]PRY30876.1 imidazolonepropionase-like amidohydrolase [Pseudosporangium ferrugineum]
MDSSYVVRAAHAFDGEAFLADGVQVHVEGGRIAAVRPRHAPVPPGLPVWDRPGATVLPGLIDTHVHLVAGDEPDALVLDAGRSAAEREQVIRRALLAQVRAGVTTVRDLGDNRFAVLDRTVRDDEPSVVGSGPPITSADGHCAALGGAVTGRDALRAAVAQRHDHGAQIVKVVVSGGAMTAGSDLLRLQFEVADVRVVVDEAHRRGLPVTAHAHPVSAVEVCLAAGVDAIEHCTCLTPYGIHTPDAVVAGLAERRVRVCPTFGRLPSLPPSPQAIEVMRRTGMTLEARFAQVGRLHTAGVPLLAGSDAGIHPAKPHGVLAHAVGELVRSGLPVSAAVAAATSEAAEACGLTGTAGRLRPGMAADLVVVDGDVQRDVLALTRIREVVLRGRPVVSAAGPPAPS